MSQHDLITDLHARHPDITHALPGDDMYARSLDLWNGGVTTRPAVIARPTSTDQVASLVRIAREHGTPLAVRGGGHDWLGRSLAADGLTIDLAVLRDVRIEGTEAIVGGGALARDLVAETSPRGLLAATGTDGSVGLAGLSLAGGYGPLLGTAGLACDNILGAEVVLADGTVTSTQEDPELLWALEGRRRELRRGHVDADRPAPRFRHRRWDRALPGVAGVDGARRLRRAHRTRDP